MKVVFAALGAYGHLFPMLPLAIACRDAGHDVVVATGAPFLDRLPVRTVPGLPAEVDLAWAEQEVRRRHPDLHGFEATLAMFGDVTAGATTATMLEVLVAERADLLVTEPLHLGAAIAGDLLDVPTLVFAIGLVPFMAVDPAPGRDRLPARTLARARSDATGHEAARPGAPRSLPALAAAAVRRRPPHPDQIGRLAGHRGRAAGLAGRAGAPDHVSTSPSARSRSVPSTSCVARPPRSPASTSICWSPSVRRAIRAVLGGAAGQRARGAVRPPGGRARAGWT